MSQQLESKGLDVPSAADYVPVGIETDRLFIRLTNIQGNGSANVYVKFPGGSVRRIDTISIYDRDNFEKQVFWNFMPEDQIAIVLVGYSPDIIFRLTADIDEVNTDIDPNLGNAVASLETRVTRLEGIVDGTVPSDGDGTGNVDAGTLAGINTNIQVLKNSMSTVESTLGSLNGVVNNNYNTLNAKIDTNYNNLDARINNLDSDGGGGVSNVIQAIVASVGSSTKTLDGSLYDRFDITGDANNTFNVTNVANTSQNERSVAIAAMTTKADTSRTYQGVDVWLSSGGNPPYANDKVGFGELIYLTNMHGAVVGKYLKDVQFKYHTPVPDSVIGNFPFASDDMESPSVASGSYFASVESMTFVNTGGFKADTPVSGKGSAIKIDLPAADVQSFQLWFTLSAATTSGFQKLLTILENSANGVCYTIEETSGTLRIRYRNATAGLTSTNMMSVAANVPYVLTVVTNVGTTSSINAYLYNRNTGIETTWSLASWPFQDRRDEDATLQLAGAITNDNPLLANGLIRAFVAYDQPISLATKAKTIQSYL
jgi:hypothetical protein